MEKFLDVTIKHIKRSGHTPEDIIFIGSERSGYQCTWDEFQKLCEQQEGNLNAFYDVAPDLIIVFKDGIKMQRCDYERGDEDDWDYQMPFVMPNEKKVMTHLFTKFADTLKELHEDPTIPEQE